VTEIRNKKVMERLGSFHNEIILIRLFFFLGFLHFHRIPFLSPTYWSAVLKNTSIYRFINLFSRHVFPPFWLK